MEVPVKKYFRLFPGNEVRFKGAYFITCNDFAKDANGRITELYCTYDPETRSGSGFEGRKVEGDDPLGRREDGGSYHGQGFRLSSEAG